MRDFMLEASISMEGNAMETSDVYTQVFQSLMPLIQIAIVLWAAKSVMDNLQTLCEDCNCGKGNKYEE